MLRIQVLQMSELSFHSTHTKRYHNNMLERIKRSLGVQRHICTMQSSYHVIVMLMQRGQPPNLLCSVLIYAKFNLLLTLCSLRSTGWSH